MYRILICDDDEATLCKISSIAESVFSDQRVKLHAFTQADQISDQILGSCDIALLDVDLQDNHCNGMHLARRIRSLRKDTVIIFITNFIEYAPEGYEVRAFRYVLKNNLDYLKTCLWDADGELKTRNHALKIQSNGEIIDLPMDDVLYLEVCQHNITVHVRKDAQSTKTYSFYGVLSDLEHQLEPKGFLRIHKSYLVNMRHLKKFQCREAVLSNGTVLRVGQKTYADKKKKYLLWKGWQ